VNKDILHRVLQPCLVFACMCAVLLLSEFFGGVIVGSLGASAFIIFVIPKGKYSTPQHIIGGYLCGALTGVVIGFIDSLFAFTGYPHVLMCAAAAALAVLLMVLAKLPHPPATALALGIADSHSFLPVAASAVAGIIFLCAVKHLLRKRLDDLFQ
jgi:CBS-domain-containing membrane protein